MVPYIQFGVDLFRVLKLQGIAEYVMGTDRMLTTKKVHIQDNPLLS